MIHRNSSSLQIADWQNQLNQAVKDPKVLFELLQLPRAYLPKALQASQSFPLKVPVAFLSRMKIGDINDPLLRQVLPMDYELVKKPGFHADPVGDRDAEKLPGLIHKYKSRVLLTLTGACGIHCRYCFRRHFDYSASNPGRKYWLDVLEYLRKHIDVNEVIFSGGDPLSLSDARLGELIKDLATIEHLRFLRLHTRLPVVIPSRVTPALVEMLQNTPLKTFVVLHVNHPQEIDDSLANTITQLKKANIDLLNQSVLLTGVNDNIDALVKLSLDLGELGVIPYYLHMLDRVEGAWHFEVTDEDAENLVQSLRAELPGYLVPRLVRDVPGNMSKINLI